MKFHSVRPLAAALLGVFPAAYGVSAWAQGNLPETVVTATRTAIPITDVLADVSIIDRAQIERAGQTGLRELLAQLPGVQIASNGSFTSSTSIFIRGAGASQTVVLIDGIRVGSATSGQPSIENIPLAQIERIEVLRGAASSLYGSDAIGGVIQIITRKGDGSGLKAEVDAGVGSEGLRQWGAGVRGGTKEVSFSLGVSAARALGISTVVNPLNTSFNPDRDGLNRQNANLQVSARPSQQHEFSVGITQQQQRYQFDGRPSPNPGNLAATRYDAFNDGMLRTANVQWAANWLPNWRTRVTFGQSEDNSTSNYVRYDTGLNVNPARFNTRQNFTSLQSDLQLGTDVFTAILEERRESIDTTQAYPVRQRGIQSAVLSYALSRGPFNGLLTLRNDRNSQFGGASTGALSLGYRLSSEWQVVGSYGTAFQAPTFNQLYFPNSGNANLKPQRSQNSELGLRYAAGTTAVKATVYRNVITDRIDFPAPAFLATQTPGQSVLSGLTLASQFNVGQTRISGSIDYTDPVNKTTGQRLNRIALLTTKIRADHPFAWGSGFVEIQDSSQRRDGAGPNLSAYTLLNLGVQWRVTRDMNLTARVNNLNDTRYELARDFSTLGRTFFVGLNYQPSW